MATSKPKKIVINVIDRVGDLGGSWDPRPPKVSISIETYNLEDNHKFNPYGFVDSIVDYLNTLGMGHCSVSIYEEEKVVKTKTHTIFDQPAAGPDNMHQISIEYPELKD